MAMNGNMEWDATLTEEGTGGKDGRDEGLLGGRDHVAGGVVLDVGGGCRASGLLCLEL